MSYRLNPARQTITRVSDGVTFAWDDRDPLWPEYAAWLAAGGSPEIDDTPGPDPVPERVTRAALKIALANAGLLASVEALIAAMPADTPARILWVDATEFRRSNAMWDASAGALGLTSADVDAVFRAAGVIDRGFD